MALLLKGAPCAAALTQAAAREAAELAARGVTPCLAVLRVGDSGDDTAYLNGILRRCEKVGVAVRVAALPDTSDTAAVLKELEALNRSDDVHGVLIMRPLPRHIDDAAVCAALDPKKDMDGVTDGAMAALYAGRKDAPAPCTARACIALLDHYGIDIAGKNAVVVGRSLVIGKPAALLLIGRNATVTVCHTKTADLAAVCKNAGILIAAAGVAGMITDRHVAPGAVVIDVGIHVGLDGGLTGDVDFAAVEPVAQAISPVPGGVGTVTSAVLASQVIKAARASL